MTSFLTYIILIFFNCINLSKSDINCMTEYKECFNCSVCGDEDSNTCNCHWDTNSKTCKTGKEKTFDSHFYVYYDSCTDSNSIEIMEKYCGNTTLALNNENEIEINIPQNGGIYGTSKLYCEYTYTATNNENDYYTIKYDFTSSLLQNMYIYLDISFNDGTLTSGYLTQKSINREFDNVKELKLLLFFNQGLTSLPFSFKIIKNKDKSKIALYITIVFILLACLLCALIIYFLSKKISENARLRQRTLIQLAMARQRGQYNTGEDQASSGSNQVDIEEENRKKIEILLKNSLAPQKFIKKLGIKDGNTCTICIEDFKEKKSKVSVTPCQHVFHYKCLSNWLIQNVLNPKCPNCNYNLLQDYDKKNIEEVNRIEVTKKTSESENIETQNIQENRENLNTNEEILYTRNMSNRNRIRINNINNNNANNNIVENGGNNNEIQEIDIENI